MSEPLLQIPWFLDPQPEWLPAAVMASGGALFTISYARAYRSGELTKFGWYFFAGFYLAIAFPWLVSQSDYVVGTLYLVGKWFQGVGTVTFYLRIRSTIEQVRNRKMPGGNRLFKKVALRLVLGVLFLIAVTVSILLILFGPIESHLRTELTIVWTVLFLMTGTAGIAWRLRSVPSEMPFGMTAGLVILVGGASIYDFQLLPDQLILLAAGGVITTAGYIGAAALWVLKQDTYATGGRY